MTWAEIFSKGGPVVFILFGYSLLAVTLVVERLLYFAFLPKPAKDFGERLTTALASRKAEKIITNLRGPEINVVRGMMAAAAAGVKDLAQVASRLGSDELQRMERGFRTLAILGNTAPLLGLLGTITGLIKAFQVIERAGGRVGCPGPGRRHLGGDDHHRRRAGGGHSGSFVAPPAGRACRYAGAGHALPCLPDS